MATGRGRFFSVAAVESLSLAASCAMAPVGRAKVTIMNSKEVRLGMVLIA